MLKISILYNNYQVTIDFKIRKLFSNQSKNISILKFICILFLFKYYFNVLFISILKVIKEDTIRLVFSIQ